MSELVKNIITTSTSASKLSGNVLIAPKDSVPDLFSNQPTTRDLLSNL